ncbi:uncharacterized protein B0T23DRAFT_434464 [Neurospora hispaniola]|uniref:Uncharacterized protein n=1 Tax=Neurospora hispaniola TaxID=588809 RepID=A0AAJ0MV59_9PEZI|nr:hypothetical protein B0T23DRAFT_434464 [Neurospora hispaniola]
MPSTYLSPVDGPHRDSARLLCVPTERKHKEEKGPAEISTRPLADKAAFGTPSQAEAGLGRITHLASHQMSGHGRGTHATSPSDVHLCRHLKGHKSEPERYIAVNFRHLYRLLTSWTTAPGHRDSHVDALGRPQIGDFYGYIGDISQPPRSKDPFYGRLGS